MLMKNYKNQDMNIWMGRIDSDTNFDAFRWHQIVESINLTDESVFEFKGELGFCFLGFCCDKGIQNNKGRIGASNAPESIRKEMRNLPVWFLEQVKLYDAGNICCENCTLEEAQKSLSVAVEKILNLNLFPIVLGGGHEVAFGHHGGILKYLKGFEEKPKLGIINFDAHFDLRPYKDSKYSSGTMFRQISDLCIEQELEFSYMCLGIQKYGNTVDLFKTANALGVSYILQRDIVHGDSWKLMEKLDDFMKKQDSIYITICSDVFSSAFAPGVSAPQPLGMEPESALNFLKYIIKSGKAISFDIAEVSPQFDQDNITANLAKVIIFSVVNTLCEQKNLSIKEILS